MRVLLVSALFALATLSGCGDDDDGGGAPDTPTPTSDSASAYCKIGAKTMELIASGLREGHSARQIVEEYGGGIETGCEATIKIWASRPHDPVGITITDQSGTALLDRQVSGTSLADLAPKSPITGQRSCANWTVPLLQQLCTKQLLDELQRTIAEQSGQ
jgi:hypothetical protein